MAASFLSTKDPSETVVLTLDATLDLAPADTLASIVSVTGTVLNGIDPAANTLFTNPVINAVPLTLTRPDGTTTTIAAGKGVQVQAGARTVNARYLVSILCARSNGIETIAVKGILHVSTA